MKRLIAALCSLAIVTLPFPPAQAGYIVAPQQIVLLLTVNTNDDHNDSSCDANDCTLREAMFAANAVSTDDIINFSVAGVINLVAPLPVISDGVTIAGPGPTVLTVQRDPAWGAFRIFEVNTTEAVSLSGLTVRQGSAIDGGGGGIKNSGTGTLSVINSKISDNGDGGPNVEVGGGIHNSSTRTIMITDSTISGNGAFLSGGGIFNATGTVKFTNCIVSDNFSRLGVGGGLHNRTGSMTITDSIISGNSAFMDGGGIFNFDGSIAIVNSTISGNLTSIGGGGGIFNSLTGLVNITSSTVSNNQAVITGSSGGGIFNDAGTVNLTNSTISGNSSGGQTTIGNGGGIYSDRGTLNITNSTISSNRAASSGGGISSLQGIANIKSTIVALNTSEFGGFGASPDVAGSFTSFGFNLVGKSDGSTDFTEPTDLTGTIAAPLDPGLDPSGLQDNGGSNKTIALVCGSAAIDKGTSAGLTSDQRGEGFARTFDDPLIINATDGEGTDIGAFELQQSAKCNHPPVADAGPDQTVECAGAATPVMLDASVSSDPDHDTLTFSWSKGGVEIATGVNPTVNLSNGTHAITVTVTDPSNESDTDEVTIIVQDTTAPAITPTANILTLYPPNHTYVTFGIADLVGSASDACDSAVDVSQAVIAQVSSDEPEDAKGNGDGATKNDIVIAPGCKSVQLRAERADQLDGRVYTIRLKIKDASGNVLEATRKVFVPVSPKSQAVDSGAAGYTVMGCAP